MTKKQAATPKTKAGRKPTVFIPAPALVAEVKKQMAREDISDCAAIRLVAKKFAKTKRGELMAAFAGYGRKPGCVSAQIHLGRRPAAS